MKNKKSLKRPLNDLEDIEIYLPFQTGDYIEIIDGKYVHVNKYGEPKNNKKEKPNVS